MNYDEYDAGAPAVSAQESADEAMACAQMERDQASVQPALDTIAEHLPF